MAKVNIEVSPAFKASLADLKSVLIGLLKMLAGTVATALISAVLSWLGTVDMTSVLVMGVPVFVYIVPVVTAVLNLALKYFTESKYVK